MTRRLQFRDRKEYLKMAEDFYSSPAVLHPVPRENFARCFEKLLSNTPLAEGYIIEKDGKTAGYAVTSLTYSQEAGGEVLWLEELYIKPEYRGQGLGTEYFDYILKTPGIARFRLEIEPDNEKAIKLYSRLGFKRFPYGQMIKE
ncbi:MAG: GNAT family N-acetyltransferase [Clostridia bacterium]|nr:GNAT family N-acetyltransferase [Clostridia bacterium]